MERWNGIYLVADRKTLNHSSFVLICLVLLAVVIDAPRRHEHDE